jgi:hypothetical protein
MGPQDEGYPDLDLSRQPSTKPRCLRSDQGPVERCAAAGDHALDLPRLCGGVPLGRARGPPTPWRASATPVGNRNRDYASVAIRLSTERGGFAQLLTPTDTPLGVNGYDRSLGEQSLQGAA